VIILLEGFIKKIKCLKINKYHSLILVQFILDASYFDSSSPQETDCKRTCLACAVVKVFGDNLFMWLFLIVYLSSYFVMV